MEQAELDTSKLLSFPPYRRSHLHSETYLTLIQIFSHLPAIPGTGDKDREYVVNDIVLGDIEETMGMEEVEDASRTLLQDRCNNADKEQQRIMDELELAVNGTHNIVCDRGVISTGAVSGEEKNDSRVAELMDYRLENDEFLHSDVKKCGNAGEM
ncbi:hypothetical protein PIB30_077960 [Stylosanthes scabra]|uniref:Uncharacterized protein n=1 Tax=Stylosanthes scabra TaxID=79078 RepID=A0ABU6WRW8_9FABA|nr:hypothetical protein [Stylosanthes scabra]